MCRYQECNTRLTHCYIVSTYMLLLLLMMANLLLVGHPYRFSLLRLQREYVEHYKDNIQQNVTGHGEGTGALMPLTHICLLTHQICSVNHVRVPITCHPVRKNCGGFLETGLE